MEYRGTQTFMLCTHLLNEAEALRDVISIMIKGCVYTYGSPQYLSAKFDDDSDESYIKVDNFFTKQIPLAELTISDLGIEFTSIPASMIKLLEFFMIMGNGKKEDNIFCYYTCSSSLESVFMEIVKISEDQNGDTIHVVSQSLLSSHSETGTNNVTAALMS